MASNKNVIQSRFNSQNKKYNFDFIIGRDSNMLLLITALMVFIATLALVCVFSVDKLFDSWNKDLSGQMTVQVLPFKSNTNKSILSKELFKNKVDNTVVLLKSKSELSSVEIISDDKVNSLLSPWLGSGIENIEIPLPILIDVKINNSKINIGNYDVKKLEQELNDKIGAINIEDHKKWVSDLKNVKNAVQFLAYFILVAIIITTSITVMYTTRAAFKAQRASIEVFHLMGAFDDFIAKQFASAVFKLTLSGAFIGLFLFGLIGFVILFMVDGLKGTIFDYIQFSSVDYATIFVIPFISAMLAKITARNTILQIIGKVK